MNTYETILIICLLTVDNFNIMLTKGACIQQLDLKTASVHSGLFSIINVIMIMLGFSVTQIFNLQIMQRTRVIVAATLFFIISLIFFYRATQSKQNQVEKLDYNFTLKKSFIYAVVSGLDIFLLGISLSILNISLFNILFIVLVVTFIGVFSGLWIGYYQGMKYQVLTNLLAGGLFVCCSVLVLTRFL